MAVRMYHGADKAFLSACAKVKERNPLFLVTYRQYRKWQRGFGSAFAAK